MIVIAEYKYFTVQTTEHPPVGRKTRDYPIVNKKSGGMIGTIYWYGHWRQFCFEASQSTVWSAECLKHLQEAVAVAKAHHQESKEG